MDCFCCFLTELLGLVLCSLYDAVADIHGYGCFIREDVKKDEIITQREANRRGKLYDKLNCTFLYDRNEDYVLDAMRKGNLIKFANCCPVETATMYPRIRIVNAEHRCVCMCVCMHRSATEIGLRVIF